MDLAFYLWKTGLDSEEAALIVSLLYGPETDGEEEEEPEELPVAA